ncbi:MAG: hypothetical protein WB496_09235, partial [Pseudolabrys sp.]
TIGTRKSSPPLGGLDGEQRTFSSPHSRFSKIFVTLCSTSKDNHTSRWRLEAGCTPRRPD